MRRSRRNPTEGFFDGKNQGSFYDEKSRWIPQTIKVNNVFSTVWTIKTPTVGYKWMIFYWNVILFKENADWAAVGARIEAGCFGS